MSVIASVRKTFVPIHREGFPFIAIFAVLTLLLFWWWQPLGWVGLILTAWCAYFFRDPPRTTPMRDGLVVSPADGRVSYAGLSVPPAELELGDAPLPRVSVFMSVFDCHVNRAPVGGRISRVIYRPGLFINADLDKASEDNERNSFVIETEGGRFGVVQIAGLVARRIVPFKREGESAAAGERIGLIRFGSRLDVYFPQGAPLLVGLGQRAIAGETVLADLRSQAGSVAFRTA